MSAEDPVADFLEREQQDLAGIEDDSNGNPTSTSNPPAADVAAPAAAGGEDFLPSLIPDATADTPPSIPLNSNSSPTPPAAAAGPAKSNSPRPVPEKILKWQEEQKERLAKKDAEEAVKIQEMKDQAKKELAEFEKKRLEQVEKSKKLNREAEVEIIRERDDGISNHGRDGHWERISKLCEFTPKLAKNQKDVSRLRSLLLQMKVSGTEPTVQ